MSLQSDIIGTIGWIAETAADEFETSSRLTEDLNFDSLDRNWLAIHLENEHEVVIASGVESEWQTVADVISTVEALREKS